MSSKQTLPVQAFRRAIGLLAGFLILSACLFLGQQLLLMLDQPRVSAVSLEGHFSKIRIDEIRPLAQGLIGQAIGDIDLKLARVELENFPWVSQARIERQWPSSLRIRIWERHAVARWGDFTLLDSQARVFMPPSEDLDQSLPILNGPRGHEKQVLENFLLLDEELKGSLFEPVTLVLDARGEWLSRNRQGVEIRLGRDAPKERATIIRGPLSRALRMSMEQVQYVDLRYGNGFSVGWNPKLPKSSSGAVGDESNG